MYDPIEIAIETRRYTNWRSQSHINRIAKSSYKKNTQARASAHRFQSKGIIQYRPANPYMGEDRGIDSLMLPPSVPNSDTISVSDSIVSQSESTRSRSETHSVSQSRSRQSSKQPPSQELIQIEEENRLLKAEIAMLQAQQVNKKLRQQLRELKRG
jgi:hypothetical protein